LDLGCIAQRRRNRSLCRAETWRSTLALWQFEFVLLPRRRLLARFGAVPGSVTAREFESESWWDDVPPAMLEQALDLVLPRGKSYSAAVPLWGDYECHRLELVCDDRGAYAELLGRVDVRQRDPRFLSALVSLATALDAVFADDEYYVIAPTMVTLADAITTSRAARFVNDPRGFLERLGTERAGDPEDAT
jgi:hypothetical protein